MSPVDAAKILDLPADTAPDQIETRFLELRQKLEERIGRAPTPGLKAKYRESLDDITAAFESLTLAADASNLPTLRRAAPTPSPRIQPAAPEPPAAPTGPSALAPTTVALLHLAGFVKFCLTALLVGLILCIPLFRIINPTDEAVIFASGMGATLTGIGAGILLWRRSVRRARQRLGEGRKNTFDNVLALGSTSLVLLFGIVSLIASSSASQRYSDESAATTLKEINEEGAKADQQVAAAERAEQEATTLLSELEAREQTLTASAADPAKRRSARALIRAQATYVHWFSESLPIQPAKRSRLKLDNARDRLASDHRDDVSLSTAHNALVEYEQLAAQIGFTVTEHKPDPAYVENFEDWQDEAARGTGWAMYNLYLTYESRHGPVEPDLATALDWLSRAAASHHPAAMANLAERLWSGQGLAASKSEANQWYRQAAEAGHANAMAILGEHFLAGDGLAQDAAQGAGWLRKSAEAGEARGMYGFGQCLAKGEGVAQDEKAAINWWIKAARLSWYGAREELKKRKVTW